MSVQAETLFEVLFQRSINAKKELIPKVDALVMFIVIGEQEGVWTMDLRAGGSGKVGKGKVDNPGLTFVLATDFLDSFVKGNFDVKQAMESGRYGIVGDRVKFEAFLRFLLA